MQVLDSDFFLVNAKEAFMENARQFLFETYCRIHQVGCVFSLYVGVKYRIYLDCFVG